MPSIWGLIGVRGTSRLRLAGVVAVWPDALGPTGMGHDHPCAAGGRAWGLCAFSAKSAWRAAQRGTHPRHPPPSERRADRTRQPKGRNQRSLARPAFAAGQATSQFPPVAGNLLTLLPEGDAMMNDIISAIDAAHDHVHMLYYIWLPDDTGTRMAQGPVRRVSPRRYLPGFWWMTTARGTLIRSALWRPDGSRQALPLQRAAPLGNPFISLLFGRIDLLQSPQDRGGGQSPVMGRQPQLRRCRLCHQAPIRALGGHPCPVGRAGRAPTTGRVRAGLDDASRRRP